jgi:hypothetical protein
LKQNIEKHQQMTRQKSTPCARPTPNNQTTWAPLDPRRTATLRLIVDEYCWHFCYQITWSLLKNMKT